MSDQTDTPLTDAAEARYFDWRVNIRSRDGSIRQHSQLNPVPDGFDTARTLELELATAHAALRKAQEALEWHDKVRRKQEQQTHSKEGYRESTLCHMTKKALTLIQQTLPKETRL